MMHGHGNEDVRLQQMRDLMSELPPRCRLVLAGDCNLREHEDLTGARAVRALVSRVLRTAGPALRCAALRFPPPMALAHAAATTVARRPAARSADLTCSPARHRHTCSGGAGPAGRVPSAGVPRSRTIHLVPASGRASTWLSGPAEQAGSSWLMLLMVGGACGAASAGARAVPSRGVHQRAPRPRATPLSLLHHAGTAIGTGITRAAPLPLSTAVSWLQAAGGASTPGRLRAEPRGWVAQRSFRPS